MSLSDLQSGDIVFAAATIINDGGIPEMPEDAVLARPGARGMLVNIGHLEENPEREIFLVKFETDAGELGPPVGCWPEELTDSPDNLRAD